MYLELLTAWVNSAQTHPKVCAVHAYILKGKVVKDLLQSGILALDEDALANNEELFANKKVGGASYDKVLVRFRVLGTTPNATWEDATLFQAYTSYHASLQEGVRDLCYVTGSEQILADKHPKGILPSDNGAKLVSSNDKINFTYRGRFLNAEEACAIGYESTQKVHAALAWLAARQGVSIGSNKRRTYICWNPKGRSVMGPMDDYEEETETGFTEAQYKERLVKTLQGYRDQLENNDDIVVMGLEAATTGRLSIVYYNELKASDFYDRLTHWGQTCCWYFKQSSSEEKPFTTVRTPLTRHIVLCAFGTERDKRLDLADGVLKEQTQRILSCIVDCKPIPRDIVQALVQRASTPLAYKCLYIRDRILSTACAVTAKFYEDRGNGGKISMAIDYKNHDRSYLFGRLLAVFEMVERATFDRSETREPNAIRLQSAYVNHPLSMWKTIEGLLIPYFERLRPGSRISYKKIISEITEKLDVSNPQQLNRPLEDLYVIGYYLQRAECYKPKQEKTEEE